MLRCWSYGFRVVLLCFFIQSNFAYAQIPEDRSLNTIRLPGKNTQTVINLINTSLQLHNDPDSAITILEKAFAISTQIKYNDGCARSLLGIGTNYFNKGELEKAKMIFRKAYAYCHASGQNKNGLLLFWFNNMASPYAVQGIADSASYYYYKALDIIEHTEASKRDSNLYAVILANVSEVWQTAGEYKQSLYYANKCLEIALKRNDSDRIADVYLNKAIIENAMGDTTGAITATRKSFDIYIQRKNFLSAQMACCVMAINFRNTDSILHYYLLALELSKKTKAPPLHKIYSGLGETYLRLKNYNEAIPYLNKARERATALNYTTDLGALYADLADAYTAIGNFELANKYQKAYSDLHDSLISKEKIQAANILEVKYRTAEKDKEIAAAKLKILTRENNLKQKNIWLISVSSIVVILLIVFVSYYLSTRRKEKLKLQQIINTQQEQQLNNLKLVMSGEEKERTRIARELHDGIMVQLAVMKMKLRKMLVTNGDEERSAIISVLEQLDNTSGELRQTAHNLMPDMLLETGLTDAVFYYCNSLQKETGLDIIFQNYGNLPKLQQEPELYLYRIIQELLQNIIKHAHALKALVQMNYHPPFLSIAVEDDGVGFDKKLIDAGMGIKSIYSRLQVLSGTMDIESKKSGTAVFIELNMEPFIKENIANNAN